MNWVGGSRSRLVMKNDAKRQREFFEKIKMQQKLKNLGIALPASPRGTSSGSMDLVTLFIVNQIAAEKENKDPPKMAVLGSYKGGSKHKRNEPLVLPMSPCSPSQLSLVESQPECSVQGAGKRTHVIPQGFKCRQLSPVLESAFSDISASDYLPPIADTVSPLSYTSSASSAQGIFPRQLNVQQRSQAPCSLPHWDTSGLVQTKFQPFSHPRVMTDCIPWSYGSNPPLYQPETPSAAQVLFRSPEPGNTEARGHARHEVTFSLSPPEDREGILDFTLNQSETKQQFEEDVFRGFSTDECEREASHFGRVSSKIYLKDETPAKSSTPQTVPDSQSMGVELSNCTDMDFSCLEHNNGLMNGSDYSSSYSCGTGYVSSDSNDDEECCLPCLQAASSYMDQACCADSLNPNLVPDKALGSNSTQTGSNTAQFESPQALAQTQISELCKCKKTSHETQDVGTQTADSPTAKTCDAATQCSLVVESTTKATGFNLCLPPVEVSVPYPATKRQTDTAAEPNTHTPLPGKASSGGKHMPWSKKKFGAAPLSGSDSKVILKIPIHPFLDAQSMTDGRGKENQEGRDERGQQENGRLMKVLSSEVREEVTSAARVDRLSDEAETLQEIADILLLLKQRKGEGW
ncbi:uncharacterized protein LOC123984878 [Micropterus dolomieu]|uniref:uncharacterized protein LOC123984878 n=1 Tax=Micropterus dolomieu TaxID=147949 RepID=UPI001E8D8ACD|nr:uncharacterized protein LOC123984878 [Micropterus dolomieu]